MQADHDRQEARTQKFSQGGQVFTKREIFFAPRAIFAPPHLAFKMLLFYIKSTTCPLGGPFSI